MTGKKMKNDPIFWAIIVLTITLLAIYIYLLSQIPVPEWGSITS